MLKLVEKTALTLECNEYKLKERNKRYLDNFCRLIFLKPFFSLLDYEVYCLSVEKEIIDLTLEERFENQFEN